MRGGVRKTIALETRDESDAIRMALELANGSDPRCVGGRHPAPDEDGSGAWEYLEETIRRWCPTFRSKHESSRASSFQVELINAR